MFSLHATGVGSGVVIGRAHIVRSPGSEIPEYLVEVDTTEQEVARLCAAGQAARLGLKKTLDELPPDTPDEVAALLAVHLLILDDPILLEEPIEQIRAQRANAESALDAHAKKLATIFAAINDPYLSGKSGDVAQVVERIMGELMDDRGDLNQQPAGKFDHAILVAHDLTPADTIALKQHKIKAFITNLGGPVSHTAILARSMGIPAIVGLHGGIRYLCSGDTLIIDGKRGVVLVDPDARALQAYRRRRNKILRRVKALNRLREAAAITLDGQQVELFSNIELPEELQQSLQHNAAGIGLYRTEFLFMNRAVLPDEQEQFEVYQRIVVQTQQPVTIRTLDLGADKQIDGGRQGESMATNPAMGRRAIRLCLHDLALFKPQLRAIYRAAAFGQVRMMVPMLSSIDELEQLAKVLKEVRQELTHQGVEFDAQLPVGGMIEVPAAAISADLFASKLDFLSIGTNDLIQYTLAIDRVDDEVNYLYDPVHPAILRLIKTVIDAGHHAQIPVSMCGEMAGDPLYTRVLLGMGLRQFSMDPAALMRIKQQIRMSDVEQLQPQVARLLHTAMPQQRRQLLAEINA